MVNCICSAAFCESVALQEITDSLPLIRRYAPSPSRRVKALA